MLSIMFEIYYIISKEERGMIGHKGNIFGKSEGVLGQ